MDFYVRADSVLALLPGRVVDYRAEVLTVRHLVVEAAQSRLAPDVPDGVGAHHLMSLRPPCGAGLCKGQK
jgi:hypothetical protein